MEGKKIQGKLRRKKTKTKKKGNDYSGVQRVSPLAHIHNKYAHSDIVDCKIHSF